MKKTFFCISLLYTLPALAQEDFLLQINDTVLSVQLDKPYQVNVKGNMVRFKVSSRDTLTYDSKLYNFLYPKAFRVSHTNVDAGIEQISLLSAEGSGILIQQYESLNPTALNELMLTEMTKESISYGFVSTRTTYKRKLKSGQEVVVTRAELRYKDDVNIYEITSIGKKDAGMIVVTMKMDDEKNTEGQKVIDLMWHSLMLK
jgi:hypothetical protein